MFFYLNAFDLISGKSLDYFLIWLFLLSKFLFLFILSFSYMLASTIFIYEFLCLNDFVRTFLILKFVHHFICSLKTTEIQYVLIWGNKFIEEKEKRKRKLVNKVSYRKWDNLKCFSNGYFRPFACFGLKL